MQVRFALGYRQHAEEKMKLDRGRKAMPRCIPGIHIFTFLRIPCVLRASHSLGLALHKTILVARLRLPRYVGRYVSIIGEDVFDRGDRKGWGEVRSDAERRRAAPRHGSLQRVPNLFLSDLFMLPSRMGGAIGWAIKRGLPRLM